MTPSPIKFLHCFPKRDYLLSALANGLLLTDHHVEFTPSKDPVAVKRMLNEVIPILRAKVAGLGHSLDAFTELQNKVVFGGIGGMSGKVPMLCFSEIPFGKNIGEHTFTFGRYGLVISRSWLESHGADRVVYVGSDSSLSRRLFALLAAMRIGGLINSKTGDLVFSNDYLRPALDFMAHVEARDNLAEAEWRIVGRHGFIGGGRDVDKRIPLPFEAIEHIFVPSFDTAAIRVEVDNLARTCSLASLVAAIPDYIPS